MKGPRAVALLTLLSLTAACGSTVATTVSGQTMSNPGSELSRAGDGLGGPGGTPATPSGSATDRRAPGALAPGTRSALPAPPGGGTPKAGARGPLTVGVVYSDNGAANGALGVATATTAGPREVMGALVTAVNRAGGLAGRRVVPDYLAVDATSSDYASRANEACTHFTQDRPVPVVLDLTFGNRFGMASCLARRGVADIGLGTLDTSADEAVGLFATPSTLTSTRRYRAVLSGLHAAGYVTPSSKVGVLLEDCAHLQRTYERTVVPELSRLGLTLTDTEHFGCSAGFASAAPASAAVQSAALRFRARGVDRLLIVSDFEQVALLLLANYAESQRWHPGYMLSSTAQTEVIRANIARGQWPQLHGMGWTPGLDVDDPHQPLPAQDRRCLALVRSGGVTVASWQDTYVATTECALLMLLGAALQQTGGDARGSVVISAIGRLGSRFSAPGVVGSRTLFGPGRHDGPGAVAHFAYVPSCTCLRYVGAPVPVP
jgi:hypothetical protein